MTTIIVKNQDFSGGKLVHYEPPIADASVCAWLGSDDPLSMRNFGTGADLTVSGAPTQVDSVFRRVNLTNYYILPEYRRETQTLLLVYRDVAPLNDTAQNISNLISSERDKSPGRRGAAINVTYPATSGSRTLSAQVFGTVSGATASVSAAVSVADSVPMMVLAEFAPNGSGAQARIQRLTTTASYPALQFNQDATMIPDTDESSYQYRVGASYRAAWGKPVDIAFLMTINRMLTSVEKAKIQASVARRMASFGFSI